MDLKENFVALPWWVKWVAIPVLVIFVFGGLIMNLVGFVISLLFKLLVLAALVGGLVYLVRKFTSSSSSSNR